jgi:hypothetical protein
LGEGDLDDDESTQSSPLPVMAPWLRCGDTPLRICNFGEIDHSPNLLSRQTPHKIHVAKESNWVINMNSYSRTYG